MNHLDLEAFLSVVKYGNLTRAAESLFISQPALTKRLLALEKELGCQLIVRGKGHKNISLTDSGKSLISIAHQYKSLDNELQTLKFKNTRKTFTICSSDGPHMYIFPKTYKDFINQYPEISLKLVTADYPQCFDAIQRQHADLAFTGADYYYKNIVSIPMYSEPMYFICRSDSNYPDTVSPDLLKACNAIYSPYSSDFTKWWDYWFRKDSKPFIEAHLIAQVEDFMLSFNKDIWTIVPASVKNKFTKNPFLSTRKLVSPPPERIIYLVKLISENNVLTSSFQTIMKENLSRIKGINLLL